MKKQLFYLLISSFVTLGSVVYAQENKSVPQLPLPLNCQPEIEKFCSDKKEPRELAKCMASHTQELSPKCKQEIERLVQMISESENRGGGALTSFGGLNAMGPPVPLISYDGQLMSGDKSPTFAENKINISAPVYKSPPDTVAMSLAAGQLHIGENISLNNGKAVSTDLHRYEIGTQYFTAYPDKSMFGIRASAGYAGDKPSRAGADTSYSINFNYGFPSESGKGYWMLMVFMANNSTLANYIPIPGFIYIYRTPNFTGMFGLPVLSLQWTPVNPWAYSLSIFGLNAQTEVSYGYRDAIQGFIGYGFQQQSFIPSDRQKERDRLTIQYQKAVLGARFSLAKLTLLEIQAGRSFDRSIYIGDGFMNTDGGHTSLEPDWITSVGLKVGF